ncbi:MAG: bifunctional 5,10-methylene-tetrahydrofolate dehydrogenase/5,10-methylene-tetrahydrofolate cyclohydrolase, partial [Clostridia bacterium]|nr:bifunctional 5,10-methylene-tetrahydrofolate dehydrogenase/5,10-methylene-tetrahydrofolate cyclohydrolase [Clostridia bacterium]
MAKIIDGKAISAAIREEISTEVKDFEAKNGFKPGLAVIIVGENPASKVYVRNKKLACEQVGFNSEVIEMPEETSESELLSVIERLNNDKDTHGILVQLPLPKHINEESVLLKINPAKDVDAFHPFNVGKIMTGNFDLAPCTPAGVMELIRRSGIEIKGKECVIVGRSNIVG